MKNLAYFKGLKTVKKFEGRHAKMICLLEKGVVKKSYHSAQRDIFEHEIEALKKLQSCEFVPRLYGVDDEKRTIYMSYCGKPLTNLDKYRKKIELYKKIMERKYGLYHNDLRDGNVCLLKGQIYFIDFGWTREFEGEGGYGAGRIGDLEKKKVVTGGKKGKVSKDELLRLIEEIYKSQELKSSYFTLKMREILVKEKIIEQPVGIVSGESTPVELKKIMEFSGSDDGSWHLSSTESFGNSSNELNDVAVGDES